VEVLVHDRIDTWLIGMPVLRKFHLLLPHEALVAEDELPHPLMWVSRPGP
jgi:hypothetical protein